ncbi:MAG TPA: Hpt domain-containing protein, partial [Steroidobacteraceae bacterium]|nr:Hpt domain-containing protein [Steroidobacteraceae bacterium]
MSLDLTQFHDAFFEESFEALDAMEAALLELDVGAPDPELINDIFRVAHSIKGGSATFGFSDIVSFTHSLETLLDELRGGRLAVTASISDLLLKSVDVLREMLRAVQAKLPVDAQRIADLQFDLELAIAKRGGARSPSTPSAPGVSGVPAASNAPADGAAPGWRIFFRPYREFFARGNDPVRMLRELATLGTIEVEVDAAQLPALAELDPQTCHLAWTVNLGGAIAEEAIREVFDWATGECDLIIERLGAKAVDGMQAEPVEPSEPAQVSLAARETASGASAEVAAAGSIRVSVEKIDELMNTVGELVITQAMLSQLSRALEGPAAEQFRSGLAQLERNMRELQESVMRVRMLPISFVFSRFPRMVRDLAQRLGKQIELKLTGEHTELDKTVLEKIGDPLVHLVRNSIDHGIEMPEARVAAGKP